MALRIVRNDITCMETEAVVNTAASAVEVGPGCDRAIYEAAGYDRLLDYRKTRIGERKEGEVFLTPGFDLPAKYIIHAVSPLFIDGTSGEEDKLRSCYRGALTLAREHGIRSIAFPLISTGSFGYPKEEGMRIAVDEIHGFLLHHRMDVALVVFGERAVGLGRRIDPDLEAYIDENYVQVKSMEEYGAERANRSRMRNLWCGRVNESAFDATPMQMDYDDFIDRMEADLEERMNHRTDTFSEYLLYLIRSRGLENASVWKDAIVDKKVFSKIKNNPDYHPNKQTALRLCIGARLSLDDSTDLLARAGYALSPCDKTDIIFSYFLEKKIYDMIELDLQLEEHGLPCIIN